MREGTGKLYNIAKVILVKELLLYVVGIAQAYAMASMGQKNAETDLTPTHISVVLTELRGMPDST